nr:hypothetical protein Iba_chr04aCG19310 [Ipomoea batatas]
MLTIVIHGKNACVLDFVGTIGRTQEVAKKRKHDHASSSRDPVEVEMQEVEDDATILEARVLRLSPEQLAKVAHLKTLKVVGEKYFDYPILDSFGCRREVSLLFNMESHAFRNY